jgi:hypothetical protein
VDVGVVARVAWTWDFGTWRAGLGIDLVAGLSWGWGHCFGRNRYYSKCLKAEISTWNQTEHGKKGKQYTIFSEG